MVEDRFDIQYSIKGQLTTDIISPTALIAKDEIISVDNHVW